MNILPPKYIKKNQWKGYENPPWLKKDKQAVTILYNILERRKSFFFRAYLQRNGFNFIDLGDHVKEDVRWGKEFGNRMECNPMYFTSGSLLRNLFRIMEEKGLSKEEMVKRYVFVSGGGQYGPCRYGMYPQEYWKAVNDAGFKGFRTLIFSSGFTSEKQPPGSALVFNLSFRINLCVAFVLADLLHIVECALRPYAKDKRKALRVIERSEQILFNAFRSPWFLFTIPANLKRVGRLLASVPRITGRLPHIYVTGEFLDRKSVV
jgi:predicted nucleotide-binding protein (sugar kinase/HSP70/actin superfamily)